MAFGKYNKRKKITLYSLGLGFLVLGATMSRGMGANPKDSSKSLSPAQKSMKQAAQHSSHAHTNSPAVATKKNMTYREHQKAALHTLGPKNKTVFHTLSDEDQQKVVETHKNGGSAHKKLTDVLNEDQAKHKSNMRKQNYYD
ncbi:MAG: hypothetical protein SP4CHLAM5_06960 [Chlamydiia bacterium]|nr:hypothetical protein [Chlamydiia bacterium]MCH9618563.1 hypothetical protein [Chlamydiia bacterium]MCH9623898.1 hypothetical protein [Chlamydiia bacterium]